MTTTNTNTNTVVEKLLNAELAQKQAIETTLIEKHGNRIVPGTVIRAVYAHDVPGAPEKWGKKFICQINTIGIDGKPDGNTRWVATSDVFHTFHTEEVSKVMRKITTQQRKEELKALMKDPDLVKKMKDPDLVKKIASAPPVLSEVVQVGWTTK